MSDFPNGAAIVFGATGGIGRVVCLELARAGSDVAIIWRSKEVVAKKLAAEIEALGRKASLHHCDVLIEGAAKDAIEEAVDRHSRLHTLVWGAGPLVEQVHFADTAREQWQTAINVCLLYTSPSPRDATLSRMPSSA